MALKAPYWWLKIRIDLADEPEVLALSRVLDLDPDLVVGKLVRVWGWAARKGKRGVVVGVTVDDVSRFARTPGFGEAMEAEGWLSRDCHAGVTQLTFPDFHKYCPQTEAHKQDAAERQRRKRERDRNAAVTRPSRKRPPKVTDKEEDKIRGRIKGITPLEHPSPAPPDAPPERPEKQPKSRIPDPVWDAVCATFSLAPVTEGERRRVGKVVRDLKLKGAAPDEIPVRLARYVRAWPEAAATPEALLKHWDLFASEAKPGTEAVAQASAEEERRRRDEKIRREREEDRRRRQGLASAGELFSDDERSQP